MTILTHCMHRIVLNRFGIFHVSVNGRFGIPAYNIFTEPESIWPLNYYIESIAIHNDIYPQIQDPFL